MSAMTAEVKEPSAVATLYSVCTKCGWVASPFTICLVFATTKRNPEAGSMAGVPVMPTSGKRLLALTSAEGTVVMVTVFAAGLRAGSAKRKESFQSTAPVWESMA